jgi:hypothetical protein
MGRPRKAGDDEGFARRSERICGDIAEMVVRPTRFKSRLNSYEIFFQKIFSTRTYPAGVRKKSRQNKDRPAGAVG